MASLSSEVRGLRETQANMEKIVADLRGGPFEHGMRDATLVVERAAKMNLVGYEGPTVGGVDTGRLRASITPEVRSLGDSIQGVVGSNVSYAPFQEVGTRPFWPPIAALETWARRHGTTAFVVARAISRRGIKGKRYLQRAFEDNKDRIIAMLEKAVAGIVSRRGG